MRGRLSGPALVSTQPIPVPLHEHLSPASGVLVLPGPSNLGWEPGCLPLKGPLGGGGGGVGGRVNSRGGGGVVRDLELLATGFWRTPLIRPLRPYEALKGP